MKKALVCGAGGFIGTHLVNDLKKRGYYVIGADLKYPEFSTTNCDEFYQYDLRILSNVDELVGMNIDEIYQLAADMGGAGYIFTGDNDADIMTNSSLININVLSSMVKHGVKNVFFASSACIYPEHNQMDPDNPNCEESSAYPANPDSEYGWEKIFSERLYLTYAKNYGLRVRIARFHNVFGPYSSWKGGKEKAPAALCRKVLESNGTVDVWGPGTQTRSFLYVDECIEGIRKLVEANNINQPVNLGSDRMVSINELVMLIAEIAGKQVTINNIPGPLGVMGRNSDNKLIKELIGWVPQNNLEYGIRETYNWIKLQEEL
jgi:nucleoside-diphosphate-sugar epimerase